MVIVELVPGKIVLSLNQYRLFDPFTGDDRFCRKTAMRRSVFI